MGAPENPPAFPAAPADCNAYAGHSGMTLHDWFAGQALAGVLASPFDDGGKTIEAHAQHYARVSYIYADAMLAERDLRSVPLPTVEPAGEVPEAFNEDMEAAPTNGTAIMGRLADDTETMMVWWANWPGWRATTAWNQMGEPVAPIAWRRLTASEDANFDDIPF